MKYQMSLSEFSFNKIRAGRRMDLRLFDKKRQSIKIGDVIEYTNLNNPREHLECQVLGMAIFENFEDLIDSLTPQLLGYDSKKELLIRLNRAYSEEKQKDFNAAAIFIRNVTPLYREFIRGEAEYER